MTEMNTENNLEAMQRAHGPLLEVKNLQVDFTTDEGKAVHAVRNSSFSVYPGQWWPSSANPVPANPLPPWPCLACFREPAMWSAAPSSLMARRSPASSRRDFDKLRGSKMGLVPQDPMSNLNPVWRIGTQVKEALVANNMDIDHESVPNSPRPWPVTKWSSRAMTMRPSLVPRNCLI